MVNVLLGGSVLDFKDYNLELKLGSKCGLGMLC